MNHISNVKLTALLIRLLKSFEVPEFHKGPDKGPKRFLATEINSDWLSLPKNRQISKVLRFHGFPKLKSKNNYS